MARSCLLLLLIIPLIRGFAQIHYLERGSRPTTHDQPIANQFDHLSVKDGLSNNSVNCILQDREGFMWSGTNDGLDKYDGNSLEDKIRTKRPRPQFSE